MLKLINFNQRILIKLKLKNNFQYQITFNEKPILFYKNFYKNNSNNKIHQYYMIMKNLLDHIIHENRN